MLRRSSLTLLPVPALCLLLVAGCSRQTPPPAAGPAASPAAAPAVSAPAERPFAEAEGYWHPQSATGFLFPDGWENLGVQQNQGIARLGLRHQTEMIEVTLYWSPVGDAIDVMTVGDLERANLAELYGDKVGEPKPILVRGKAGFKIPIKGGPVGIDDPNLVGVIYVFGIPNGEWYKIKLRATATSEDGIAKVEKLLDNYRW